MKGSRKLQVMTVFNKKRLHIDCEGGLLEFCCKFNLVFKLKMFTNKPEKKKMYVCWELDHKKVSC